MEDAINPFTGLWQERARRLMHDRRMRLLAGAFLMLIALAGWSTAAPERFTAVFDTLVAVDLEQSRIDTPLPTPQGGQWLGQRFIPRHDGLTEVEITLLRYGDATAGEDGLLTLQLLDETGQLLAEKRLQTAVIAHNQIERLSFSPLPNSAGQPYLLRLSGSPENKVSAWGYSLDVYKDGTVELGGQATAEHERAAAQDMRFTTRYQLTWSGALNAVGEALFYEGALFALALIFLPLPGVLVLYLYRRLGTRGPTERDAREAVVWDPAAWWGAALALGVAVWPLLWLWSTALGIHWGRWSLAALLVCGWAVAAWVWWRERGRALSAEGSLVCLPLARPWRWSHLVLLAILLLGLAVRLLAVRDVSFLPWVDASRHGLITAVMAANGQVIRDYAPYLPVDRFPYHFGFHTLSSSLYLLSDWPLERLLLYLGQLLNALVPLTMFTAVWLLLRRQSAALIAGFLVALPFFFPAYYTTWGRMTQLTAVLILPVLLAFTWQMVRGKGRWSCLWPLLGLLLAGLFLIHVRVFVYFLPFPLLVWLVSRLRNTRWLAAAGGLAFALVLPHLFHLAADANPERPLGGTIPDYNVFPINYVTTGWERYFLGAAALGLLVLLLGVWRRKAWVVLPAVLLAWTGLLMGLLFSDRLGVPLPSLFNLNSMYIILFVPLAIYLAIIGDQIWGWLAERTRPWQWVGYGLSGALLMALLVFGVRQQIAILNPQTLLALPEDVPAIRWVDENLPPEAVLAVNSWRWLGQTWAGSDGGAWILPLTRRMVSTPPIDHIYNAELFADVRAFNEAATAVPDWSDPAQATWLHEQGITHIFVGKRGGFFDPAKLLNNERMEMLYGRDGAFVFAVRE
jgi:hypothetical protein